MVIVLVTISDYPRSRYHDVYIIQSCKHWWVILLICPLAKRKFNVGENKPETKACLGDVIYYTRTSGQLAYNPRLDTLVIVQAILRSTVGITAKLRVVWDRGELKYTAVRDVLSHVRRRTLAERRRLGRSRLAALVHGLCLAVTVSRRHII